MRERNAYVLCNQVLLFALSVSLEAIMLQPQCRRQSKRSEGALAESGGGGLKQTKLLHIETDLQILYGYQCS